MAINILKDSKVESAKPAEKDKRLNDGGGLYMLVKPNGSKWWRFDYTFAGKRKTLSVGVYPATGLAEARRKAEGARANVAAGVDPSDNRKEAKKNIQTALENEKLLESGMSLIGSFEYVAREWGSKKIATWDAKDNRSKRLLEINVFPWLGHVPIKDILPMDILECLRRVEERGAIETARRTLQVCGQVFRYGVANGLVKGDITRDLRGALATSQSTHFAAVTSPKKIAPLLKTIDGYTGGFVVKSALQLAPLVFVRPGELRQAEWAHIDFEAKEWRYLITKTRTPHIVPLSHQAFEILENLHPLTGRGRFVFPSARTPNGSRAMSDAALCAALRYLSISKEEMSIHGFRAMARTVLDEVLEFRVDLIEHQLGHVVRDTNGRAYNRTAHLPARHRMMQSWADYLDGLKNN
jgi:integrase